MLHDLQLLGSFYAPEQPTSLPLMEHLATAPTTVVPASAPTGVVPWTEFTDVPEWLSMTDCFTRGPEMVPSTAEVPTTEPLCEVRQPSERTLTDEELEAHLHEQDGATVLEPTMEEEPSAAQEFLLDLEHSRMVEAGLVEYPFALTTPEDVGVPCVLLQTQIPPPSWHRAQG